MAINALMKIKKSKTARFRKKNIVLYLGGEDGERLYLRDAKFKMANGRKVQISKTAIPGTNPEYLIARSKGRYALLALFSLPGCQILDFPCGSGYAADFLKDYRVAYNGKDIDEVTIEYAKRNYGGKNASFEVGDLRSPKLPANYYDTIGCIEGLEHIEKKYQKPLIAALFRALKPGGILIISSPENTAGVSGPSKGNPYHKWELNKNDFLELLYTKFQPEKVELVTQEAVLSYDSEITTCFFGICHKEHENKK